MKIWFNKDDIKNIRFQSEQLIITPFLLSSFIQTNESFLDIDHYIDKIKNCIKFTNIEDCDYIIYPIKFDVNIKPYIELGLKFNKKVLAFYNDDNNLPVSDIPNLLLYRICMFKSKQKPNEFSMPTWSIDFKHYGEIPLRIKTKKPTIGFCGYVYHPETNIRQQCIQLLQKTSKFNNNFIIRSQFWGGKIDDPYLRKEYVNNMLNSDFILCVRGSGNASYRFYETLSTGRIPIFIDTDCVIPFENKIDFTQLFPIIKERNLYNIENIILDFWNNIYDYTKLQYNLRKLYEQYYSPYGFIEQICENL